WRLAMVLPLDKPDGAIERGRSIDQLQHHLFFPTELSLQHFVIKYEWLARSTNIYYAIAHVPATIIFLVWLFVRHRREYSLWRNCLAMLTAACLVIRFARVAPPRFFPELGYIDLATRYGLSVYGPVGTGVSDQFAAMPSIHVGWAAIVSFGVFAATTSRWRWLFSSHLVLTMLAVSATGNHWWLDGIAAIALLGVAVIIDRSVRNKFNARTRSVWL
ncbi:MAG: inositol phosphorylceramide synthase, partial [Ilumatobacteraceae bacterium]|nr:inositol phosphorylceramide synthase [Ilumatobacteraceae bacterium]